MRKLNKRSYLVNGHTLTVNDYWYSNKNSSDVGINSVGIKDEPLMKLRRSRPARPQQTLVVAEVLEDFDIEDFDFEDLFEDE